MKLVRVRRKDDGRVEIHTLAAGTTAASILAQQIANHLMQSETREYKDATSHDSELLYRAEVAQRGFVSPLCLYRARKRAYLRQVEEVEQ